MPDITALDPVLRLETALEAANLHALRMFRLGPYRLPEPAEGRQSPHDMTNAANVQLSARMLIDDLMLLIQACGYNADALMEVDLAQRRAVKDRA